MAVIKTNLRCDLQKAVEVQYLRGNLFSQDVQANEINVAVLDGGEPAAISGTVTAKIIRSDGGTVSATGGTISGNIASITLPAAAYAVPGVVSITVQLTDSGVITTIAAVVTNIYKTSTDTVVDPGTIIPSITALISQIETAVASIPADYSSLWTSLAPAFSASKSGGYKIGEYVTNGGVLYVCIVPHTGSWVAGHFAATDVGTGLSDLKSAFTLTVGNTNDGYKTILLNDWESGGYNASGKYSTGDKIRIKTLIPVEKGKTYVFKYSGVAFDTVRYTSTEYTGGTAIDWGVTEDKTYTMGNNYYWGIALRTSDLGVSKPCVAQKNVLALAADAIGNTDHSPSMIQYGTDSVDGSLVPRNDRICTELKFRVEDIISISINDGYQFLVAKFNDNDEFLGNTSWGTSIAKSSISGTNFRVTVKANNGGNISPSASTGLTIKLETQSTTGLLLKGYKEIAERKAGDNALKEQIEGIKSVVDADSIGINQIARLGWKPYAAYYPPEQSLASYKLAYAMGMRILLADLRKTSDGVLVCIHDESINSVARNDDGTELSSTVNVADHTLAELNEYDYGIKKGWPNEGLLTLDEFLKLCGQINCIPVIETKIWLTVEETENLCLMVRKYGLQDGFIWAEMPETTIANRTCTIVRNMLPNAAIMIRGGSYSDDALNDAIAFSGAGKKTILSFTDFDYITTETVATCREHNIDIEYSQVDTTSAMDTLYANSHFSDVRYWVSAEFNVHDYIMGKIT